MGHTLTTLVHYARIGELLNDSDSKIEKVVQDYNLSDDIKFNFYELSRNTINGARNSVAEIEASIDNITDNKEVKDKILRIIVDLHMKYARQFILPKESYEFEKSSEKRADNAPNEMIP